MSEVRSVNMGASMGSSRCRVYKSVPTLTPTAKFAGKLRPHTTNILTGFASRIYAMPLGSAEGKGGSL